jgi:uncharacterized protein (DUF2336 family)
MPHRISTAPSAAAQNSAPSRDNGQAAAAQSLIDQLEDAITKQNLRQRAAVMRRVTDLFILNGAGFSEDHVAMFDDVMCRLVAAIDKSARAEFGNLLAQCSNAPRKTSRILALDDEIAVAGPMLSQSECLDEETIVEGATTKSQDHLLAISQRGSISEAVTDVLVDRGNTEVVVKTAANSGAKFSEFGCAILVGRSGEDRELALRVWLRPDIPRHHLLSLFASASEEVQRQLEVADRQKVELYRYIVAQARNQIQTQIREGSANYATARPYVEGLHRSGDLNGERVLAFARDGKFDEVTVALSLMGDLPVGHIERAFVHNQADHLLVIAKAIGLSWETTKAILVMRESRESSESSADRKIGMHRNSFIRLQQSTALSALQFYRLRARAEAQLEKNS